MQYDSDAKRERSRFHAACSAFDLRASVQKNCSALVRMLEGLRPRALQAMALVRGNDVRFATPRAFVVVDIRAAHA